MKIAPPVTKKKKPIPLHRSMFFTFDTLGMELLCCDICMAFKTQNILFHYTTHEVMKIDNALFSSTSFFEDKTYFSLVKRPFKPVMCFYFWQF